MHTPGETGLSQDSPCGQLGSTQHVSSTQLPDMQFAPASHREPSGSGVLVGVTVGVGVEVGVGVKVAQLAWQLPSLVQLKSAEPSAHRSTSALRHEGALSQIAWQISSLVSSLAMQFVPAANVLKQHPGRASAVCGVRKIAPLATSTAAKHKALESSRMETRFPLVGVLREYMDLSLWNEADVESVAIQEAAIAQLDDLGATLIDPGPVGRADEFAVPETALSRSLEGRGGVVGIVAFVFTVTFRWTATPSSRSVTPGHD